MFHFRLEFPMYLHLQTHCIVSFGYLLFRSIAHQFYSWLRLCGLNGWVCRNLIYLWREKKKTTIFKLDEWIESKVNKRDFWWFYRQHEATAYSVLYSLFIVLRIIFLYINSIRKLLKRKKKQIKRAKNKLNSCAHTPSHVYTNTSTNFLSHSFWLWSFVVFFYFYSDVTVQTEWKRRVPKQKN